MGDKISGHASNLVGFNLNLCSFTYYVYIYIHMDIGMLLLFHHRRTFSVNNIAQESVQVFSYTMMKPLKPTDWTM